jgi:Hypothetical glycosyl hydrolase 6/Beta-galactosidase trimerisation domain
MISLPRRQVHIDFHTSEHIEDIGVEFDADRFAHLLKTAHVNSVNLCAKCHHGWSYYDTAVGARHPHLKFDLLRAQYEAVKRAGIAAVLYFTCGWEERSARLHTEWREVSPDGTLHTAGDGNSLGTGWKFMCFNTPYLDEVTAQLRELAAAFPDADGYWLDIIHGNECCCASCIASMNRNGLDWQKADDRRVHAYRTRDRYMEETNKAARTLNPDMPVFHNSGHLPRGDREIFKHFSHLEIESLPTGGWGYDHFPLSAAYARTLGKPYLGMTGKFHTMWGEFGGYKHPSALRYENALMSAFGAGCSIGDQLHPTGEMDSSTYAMIGKVYAEAEEKEPWCEEVVPVADIALLSAASLYATGETGEGARDSFPDNGAVRLLLEAHYLFDVIDRHADFSPYKLIILPDAIRLDPALAEKLDAYKEIGGRLLLTGESGLAVGEDRFAIDIGASHEGVSQYSPDYVLARSDLRPDFVDSPIVMYAASQRIRVTSGDSLGDVYDPYFNRTPKHFCSHQHTPPSPNVSGHAAGVIKGSVAYLAHPVFSIYWDKGAVTAKEYVVRLLDLLLGDQRTATTSLPSFGRMTLNRQVRHNRDVLHLLCAVPISRGTFRGRPIEVVEDAATVSDVSVNIRTEGPVARVTLEPQGTEIPVEAKDGMISFSVDRVDVHQMVVLHYG